jgi:hypothetical protein
MALKDLLKIQFSVEHANASPQTFSIMSGLEDVQQICSLIAAAGPFPAGLGDPETLAQTILAAIYQDDDAHDTCSLTACLNPLHPGPCKGWKGTLFKVSPGAWHSIEAAKVEKANAARIKKIEALKAQGKPIPKKLLTPIVAKPHPQAGQTANKATGEAHAAGQAVSDAAGVHVQTPGKVTLGQAVKPVGPVEKGPKGKKPTLASKGIAFIIAQEKVTPQYKLDKAAAITPEQWAGLSEADQSIIRGELAKVKIDGFGPQQKKADELLAKLTIAKPDAVEKAQATNADFQKEQAAIAKAAAPLAAPGKVTLGQAAKPVNKIGPAHKAEAEKKIAEILDKAKATPPKVQEAHEPGNPTSAGQVAAIVALSNAIPGVKSMPEGVLGKLVEVFDKMKAQGDLKDAGPFKNAVNALAQAALKVAAQDKMPGLGHGQNDVGITEFNHQIADHIAEGKPGLPPLVAKMLAHHEASKPENVKAGIEKAAKEAAAKKVAEKAAPPQVQEMQEAVPAPAVAAHHTPLKPGEPLSAKNYTPAMSDATAMAGTFVSPPKIIALQTSFAERFKTYQKLNAEEWKALPDGTKTAIVKDAIASAAADQQLHQGYIDESGKAYTPVSAWMKRRNIELPALDQNKIDKWVPQFAKDKPVKPTVQTLIPEKTTVESKNIFGEHSNVTKVVHPQYDTPKATPAAPAAPATLDVPPLAEPVENKGAGINADTTVMTPVNVAAKIKKDGSADLILGGKKVKVGFDGSGHEGTLVMVPGGFYVVTTTSGEKYNLGKGEHVTVANTTTPAPATAPPVHVSNAVAMAQGVAPGASWAKNQLVAYQELSKPEFDSLAPDIQAKIVADLKKGVTKFLDPKKITATNKLLEKFGAAKAAEAPKPDVVKPGINFAQGIKDPDLSAKQAKEMAQAATPVMLFKAAKDAAGLNELDNPDNVEHAMAADDAAEALVGQKTKLYTSAVLDKPEVAKAVAALNDAATAQYHANAVAKAKASAYNKINMKVASGSSDLTPLQKASLIQYHQYLLAHDTPPSSTADIDELKAATKQAENDLADKLHAAVKQANAPKPAAMSNAQIWDRAKELLEDGASTPSTTLDPATVLNIASAGQALADAAAKNYSPAVLADEMVAAKLAKLASVHAKILDATARVNKLETHLKAYHYDALKIGQDKDGNPLTSEDREVIAKQAEMLKAANGHLYADLDAAKAKLTAAEDQFHASAKSAQGYLKPAGPVTLTDYDKGLIPEIYSDAWGKHASKAVLYGVKSYSQKADMKSHSDYPSLTQDLGNLKKLAGVLALSVAEEKAAKEAVPTDPDTGVMLKGPEQDAWLKAASHGDDLASQFASQHKIAQQKLDAIRASVGLSKRSIPKVDAAGVKTAAAEAAYFKTAGYGQPNYGKIASAKQYLVAKLGPSFAVAHKTPSDKAAAKTAKLSATLPPMPAPKVHAKPPTTEIGKNPNAASAASNGYHFIDTVAGGDQHGWVPAQSGAYVSSPEHLAALQGHLANADTKFGLEAQKEFKWSINNMESKGASSSGKSALYAYTGSSYGNINTKLNSLPPGAKKTGSSQITSIDNAFAASPPLEGDVVLYRGFSSPETVFKSGKWNDVNVAGVEWSQRSYSSTSGALSTAQTFAGYNGVVMRIIIPKGLGIKGINAKGGQHPGENEIILQRGLRYRVVADYGKHSGKRYVDVMVVPNPYDQPE